MKNKNKPIPKLFQQHLKETGQSQAQFAREINRILEGHPQLSRQTIRNYVEGERQPEYFRMAFLNIKSSGAIHALTANVLRVLNPQIELLEVVR